VDDTITEQRRFWSINRNRCQRYFEKEIRCGLYRLHNTGCMQS